MIELCCEYFSVHCIWLYVIIMSCTSFWVSLLSIVCLNIKDFFARSRHHILSSIYSNRIQTHNHLVHKQMLKPSVRPAKWFSCVVSTYLYCAFGCFFLSCHIWVSEWIYTLVCLNVKELLSWTRHYIWSFSENDRFLTHNDLVCKRTLYYLLTVANWLSCVVSTCLHVAFDCIFLSCHIQVSAWIYTL